MRSFIVTASIAAALLLVCSRAIAHEPLTAGQAINSRLREVHFDKTSLSDVIDYLSNLTGADFDVDWKALQDAGVGKDAEISIELHRIRIGRLIDLTLQQASPDGKLTYYVEDGTIEITTVAKADKDIVTQVFDVTDLVGLNTSFTGTTLGQPPTVGASGGSLGGGGTSGGGGGSASSNSGAQTSRTGSQGNSNMQQLIQIIQHNVRPEIWRANGGKATMDFYENYLIVSAPRSVLKLVSEELE